MKEENELTYYEKVKDWNFDSFEIESDYLTNWNLYELLNKLARFKNIRLRNWWRRKSVKKFS